MDDNKSTAKRSWADTVTCAESATPRCSELVAVTVETKVWVSVVVLVLVTVETETRVAVLVLTSVSVAVSTRAWVLLDPVDIDELCISTIPMAELQTINTTAMAAAG